MSASAQRELPTRRIGCVALPHRNRRDVKLAACCSDRQKRCCLRLDGIEPGNSSPLFVRGADQRHCIGAAIAVVHSNEAVSKEERCIRRRAGPALRTACRAAFLAQLIAAKLGVSTRALTAAARATTHPKYPTQPPQKSNGRAVTPSTLPCKRTRASCSSTSVNNSDMQIRVSFEPQSHAASRTRTPCCRHPGSILSHCCAGGSVRAWRASRRIQPERCALPQRAAATALRTAAQLALVRR